MRTLLLVVASSLAGCGGAAAGLDAGMDASTSDGGARDGGARDGGARDGGARDGGELPGDAARDADVDAASSVDGGEIDCSVIGCGPPTVCGGECSSPCGCCACGDGEEVMIGGEQYVCSGGCYARRGTGGSGDVCGSTADCGAGLSCCYPCGIPDCDFVCEPTCEEGTPGCAGGCLARP